jgi:hypothetical protein
MIRRRFPLQRRRIRALWHPSEMKAMTPASVVDLPVCNFYPNGRVDVQPLWQAVGITPQLGTVPQTPRMIVNYVRSEIDRPGWCPFESVAEVSAPDSDFLRIHLKPQPRRISPKIRKLYET